MKLAHILLEYNVYNVRDIEPSIQNLVRHLPDEIVSRLTRAIKREAINNLDFLQPLAQVPRGSPEWAQQAASRGELYQFYLNPEIKEKIEHIGHYLTSAIDDSERPLNRDMPDFSFLNQRKIDSTNTLKNLDKMSWRDLIKKSQDYFNALASRGHKDDTGTHTVLDTNMGYRWVQLDTQEAFVREGQVLQNCIGGHWDKARTERAGQQILVLKDSTNASHVAARLKKQDIEEIKGKQNRPPGQKYMPATNALIKALKLKPSFGAVIDFEGAGYVWDEKIQTMVSVLSIYPPEVVANLPNNQELIKWTSPKDIWQKSFQGSPYNPGDLRYDLVQSGVIKISVSLTGTTLTAVGNLPQKPKTSTVIAMLKLMGSSLTITDVSNVAQQQFAELGVFYKNGEPLTQDEYLVPQTVMEVPQGKWIETGVPVFLARNILSRLNLTGPDGDWFGKNVKVLRLTDSQGQEQIRTFYTDDSRKLWKIVGPEAFDSTDAGYHPDDNPDDDPDDNPVQGLQAWSFEDLNANLLPVMKKLNLQFGPNMNLVFNKQGKIDDFEQTFPPEPVGKLGSQTWVKVPDAALRQGLLEKYDHFADYVPGLSKQIIQAGSVYFLVDEISTQGCQNAPMVYVDNNTFVYESFDRKPDIPANQKVSQLNSLLDLLNIDTFKPNHDEMYWQRQIIWLPGDRRPQNTNKWATQDLVLDLGALGKVYRAPKAMKDLIWAFFEQKTYARAETYYIVMPPEADTLYQAGYIAVNKNNKYLGTSPRLQGLMQKIAQDHLDEIISASGAKPPPKTAKKIREFLPQGKLHDMLDFISRNPGRGRSGWAGYVLGYGPGSQMPSISSEKSLDGFALQNNLITVRDPGRSETTYQIRITPKGQRILDKLNSGQSVSISEIVGND